MNVEKFFLALNPAKIKMGLQRTHKLLELCGNPEKKLTIIHYRLLLLTKELYLNCIYYSFNYA